MASALVNNAGVTAADGFLDFSAGASTTTAPFSWLSPTRVSSMGGRERDSRNRDRENKQQQQQLSGKNVATAAAVAVERKASDDVVVGEMDEFEFRLGDPVGGMLSADELFADGKLVPLQFAAATTTRASTCVPAVNNSPETVEMEAADSLGSADRPSVLISPRAPKCSSRWKELLRFKKAAQSAKLEQVQKAAAAAAPTHGGVQQQQQHCCNHQQQHPAVSGNCNTSCNNNLRSLRHFLHRNSPNKLFSSISSSDGCSLNLPLLRGDLDSSSSSSDSISIPARLSLSSSSSSAADHDELPRLSLDSDRPASRNNQPPRLWLSKAHGVSSISGSGDPVRIGRSPGRRGSSEEAPPPPRCASVDSPRMNSSGKVVFQNLGRSSSSPSSIGGGCGGVGRSKGGRAGVDRCYSTNVRITPVLNVPVCSLKSGSVFGLGLFSPQKKTDRDSHSHRGDQHGSRSSSRGGGSNNNGGKQSERERI